MLPQVNAELLSIGSDGASEDWDQPVGAPTATKWSGIADAYVMQKVRTVFSTNEGGLVKQRDMSIIVPATLVGPDGQKLTIQTGDILTYSFRGETISRRIMDYESPYLPGMNIQEYVRVHLVPEPVETNLSQN